MRRLHALALAALVAGAALAPASASAETQTASFGNTTAELSFTRTGDNFSDVREKITRSGVTLLDQPASSSTVCPDCPPRPAIGGTQTSAVRVLQLDSSPDPEVIFDFFTGGAHCCVYSQIFRYVPGSNSYSGLVQDWLDPGYRLEDLKGNGRPEFVSGDGRFAYVFGSFASTQFPPQIWRYDAGQMLDVTRQFPAIVAADAQDLLRRYRKGHRRTKFQQFLERQILLTYTADQCLLGSCGTGLKLARKSVAAGEVERGKRYLRGLKRFLRSTGYL